MLKVAAPDSSKFENNMPIKDGKDTEKDIMKKKVILVGETDFCAALSLRLALQDDGYQYWAASGVADARALLIENDFDVALVDVHLPDGNGLEVLRTLRIRQPDCVVIMLTGYASLETAIAALRQGAYDYLIKPCDLEELRFILKTTEGLGIAVA